MQDRYVIFDLEASCDHDNSTMTMETIEIGAVDTEGHVFDSFVKPIVNPILTDYCQDLTSITQADVDAAETFPHVWPSFLDFVGSSPMLSWGAYDRRQLLSDLHLHHITEGVDVVNHQHMNLKDYYRVIMHRRAKGMDAELRRLQLPLDGVHHRGVDDAKNLLKIFNYLLDRSHGELPDRLEMERP